MNSVHLYYEKLGTGNPVVLVHGFPLNHTIWLPVVNRLKDKATFILPDLRGHGRSPVPDGTYTMDLMAADLAALLDRLDCHKAILVGHSMGGYVSLAFVMQYPERVSGLGLVASQAGSDTPERREGRYNSAQELEEQGIGPLAEAMPAKLTHKSDLQPGLMALIQASPAKGAAACQRGMAERIDSTPFLTAVNVPSIVIAGDSDAIIPIEKSEQMATELPYCQLFRVANGGHMPMLEVPELVAGAINSLIRQVWG